VVNLRWSIPLLRRGGSREATDGVVGCVSVYAWRTTPALRATPPKEGNLRWTDPTLPNLPCGHVDVTVYRKRHFPCSPSRLPHQRAGPSCQVRKAALVVATISRCSQPAEVTPPQTMTR